MQYEQLNKHEHIVLPIVHVTDSFCLFVLNVDYTEKEKEKKDKEKMNGLLPTLTLQHQRHQTTCRRQSCLRHLALISTVRVSRASESRASVWFGWCRKKSRYIATPGSTVPLMTLWIGRIIKPITLRTGASSPTHW